MASKVGEAYVLIHTRTRPMTTAQKRAMERQAKDGARAWTSAFGKEVEKNADASLMKAQQRLAKMFADDDFSALRKELGSTEETANHLRGSLQNLYKQGQLNKREWKVLANQVKAWETRMREADATMKRMAEDDAFGDWVKKQEAAHQKSMKALQKDLDGQIRYHRTMSALRATGLRNELKDWDTRFREAEKHVKQMEVQRDRDAASAEKHAESLRRKNEKILRDMEAFDRQVRAADRAAERREERRLQIVERQTEREAVALSKRLGINRYYLNTLRDDYLKGMKEVYEVFDRNDQGATQFTRSMQRMNRQLNAMPNIVGVMFGRGSRNNLLNFVGSMMRNLSRLPGLATTGFSAIIDRVVSTGQAFKVLKGQVGGARAAGILFRAAAGNMIAILGTLVIAITSAAFAIPALAAAISLLTGIITAWVGVVATGLLGMLVLLAPLIIGVGGAFLAAALAGMDFYGTMSALKGDGEELTGEMKKMDDALTRLKGTFQGFINQTAPQGVRMFSLLTEAASSFLRAVGPGLARGMKQFNDILSSDTLTPALKVWRETLPRMTEAFTAGLGHMIAGFVQFFAAILPWVERLSVGFRDMMERFNDWTASAKGQNTVATWMERAWKAASTLWSILGEVWSILGTIFNVGTDTTGQNFLDTLLEKLQTFDEYLKSDEGRQALIDWFEDAEEFASDLWGWIEELGKAFDKLDTEEARENLRKFAETVEYMLSGVDDVAKFFEILTTGIKSLSGEWDNKNTYNTGIDLGSRLGMAPEDAKYVATHWSESFEEAMLRALLPDKWVENIKRLDERINSALRTTFDVDGETFGEIGGNIARKLWRGVESWWGTNEHNQNWVKHAFDVPGETWIEIADNIVAKLFQAIENGFNSWIGENDWTKQKFREMFNVEGETWAEIAQDVWAGFTQGLSDGWNDTVVEPWQRFIERVKEILGIASPSTVFYQIAVDVIQGFINGFTGMWGTLWSIVSTSFLSIVTSAGTWMSQLVTDVGTWLSELPGKFSTWLSQSWSEVETWFSDMWSSATTWAGDLVSDVIDYVDDLPGDFTTWLSDAWGKVDSYFSDMYDSAVGWAGDLVDDAVSAISGLPGRIGSALSGLAGAIAAPFQSAYETARGWMSRITGLGGGRSITVSAAGGGSSRFATGGLVTRPTRALIGEEGPELVVPLRRHLSQVDPTVRALSAMLQGKTLTASGTAGLGQARPQIVFGEGSIVVQTLATDVAGVAESVVDRIAARAGI